MYDGVITERRRTETVPAMINTADLPFSWRCCNRRRSRSTGGDQFKLSVADRIVFRRYLFEEGQVQCRVLAVFCAKNLQGIE